MTDGDVLLGEMGRRPMQLPRGAELHLGALLSFRDLQSVRTARLVVATLAELIAGLPRGRLEMRNGLGLMPLHSAAADLASAEVVAALPLPSVAINAEERITVLNAPAEDLLGKGLLGRHFVTALRQPGLVEAVERCLSGAGPCQARFTSIGGEHGTTYDVSLRPVGAHGIVLLSFNDVTEIALEHKRDRAAFYLQRFISYY